MENKKDIISAIVGGTFFAIPYLGLSITLAPALAIGAAAFGASELVLSSVKTKEILKDTNRSLYLKLNTAKKQNKEIYNLISKVESESTKNNLKSIYVTVNKIVATVEENPKKANSLGNFFDYYLPVLIKIVNKYDEVENQRLISEEGKEFMAKADKMIADTKKAFETLLSNLYEKDIIDADADMKVYNIMLKADGIVDDNLIMKGSDQSEE